MQAPVLNQSKRCYYGLVAYQEKLSLDKLRLLATGFEELREGSLYMIIGTLLLFIGIAAIYATVGLTLSAGNLVTAVTSVIAGGILALIAAILLLVGLVKWRHGGSYFRQFDPAHYSYAESGPKYMLWSVYIGILALLIVLAGAAARSGGLLGLGVLLIIIAGLVGLIGEILFGIFLLRIKDLSVMYGLNVPDFTIDAVLWFLGIIFELLTFIATILIYMHAGEAVTAIKVAETELAKGGESETI